MNYFIKSCLLIAGLLLSINLSAQFTNYSFSQNTTTGIYTPITSGSVAASGIGLADDRFPVTLPFTFVLGGVAYNSAYLCVNGYISLGTIDPGTDAYAINSSATGQSMIAGMSTNLASLNATTELRYETQGIAPNRTFIVQWKNFGYNASSLLTANFQIRLSEASNNVNVIFGSCTLGGSSSSISVQSGLRGTSNSSYFHRTAGSNSWGSTANASSSSASISYITGGNPSSGLTYTFTAPPLCAAPSGPSGFSFTSTTSSIAGSFAAASGADYYLTVRTPAGIPLNTNPVTGTIYATGSTLGNGTVVAAGSSTSFTNSGLTTLTEYTYTIFAAKNASCMLGPAYNTSSPLVATAMTAGPRSYSWLPTTGSANFAAAGNWSPARIFTDANDTLNFNNGGSSVATNVPDQTVSIVKVANQTSVTLRATANNTEFTIKKLLRIDALSVLTMGGNSTFTAEFTNTSGSTDAHIYGTINFDGKARYNGANANTIVYGTANVNGAGSSIIFSGSVVGNIKYAAGSFYNHNRNGGTISAGSYDATSTVTVTGVVDTVVDMGSKIFGNLVWDCPGQIAILTTLNQIGGVQGNLIINNTNTYSFGFGGFDIDKDFIQNSGTAKLISDLIVRGNTFLNAGVLDLSSKLTAFGNYTQAAGHLILGSNSSGRIIEFAGTIHKNVVAQGTTSGNTIGYTLNNPAGATLTGSLSVYGTSANAGINTVTAGGWTGTGNFIYSGITTLSYSGLNYIQSSTMEWPAANGPYNVVLALGGQVPINEVAIPGTRTVPGTFTLTRGILALNSYDLILPNGIIGTGAGQLATDTSMIAADSTGRLMMKVGTWVYGSISQPPVYHFPIGDRTGTLQKTPFAITIYGNGVQRYIGVNVHNRRHPNDASTTNCLKRYWSVTDDGGTAPMIYKTAFTYFLEDTVLGRNFYLNRWSGSSWQPVSGNQSAGLTGNAAILIGGDSLNNATTDPLGNADYTARSSTNNVYTWTPTVNKLFTVPANWTPARNTILSTDVLQFNSGAIDTVKNVPQQHAIARLSVTNNTKIILQSGALPPGTSTSTSFNIYSDLNPATDELFVENGSGILCMNTALDMNLRVTGPGATATIAGRIELLNNYFAYENTLNLTGTKATVTPTGYLSAGGTNNTAAIVGDTNTTVYGTYEDKYTTAAGVYPKFKWAPGSNYLITGYTTVTQIQLGEVYNLTYNCPAQTSVLTLSPTIINIRNNFNIISTGATGTLKFIGSNFPIKNYYQTGGKVDLQYSISVSDTFSQSGGTLGSSAGSAIKFAGTSGRQQVYFTDAAPTGGVTYWVSNPNGIQLNGLGTLSGFGINANGGLVVSATASPAIASALSLNYATGSYLMYNTPGNITADATTFPAVNGPRKLRVVLGLPQYVLTLPFSRTLADSLNMTSGDIDLGANNLTLGASPAAIGGLAYTTGTIRLTTGGFTRWYGTSNLAVTPAGNSGFYPLGTATSKRSAWIYFNGTAALSTGGTITGSITDANGITTGLSVTDNAFTIGRRTNSAWTMTPGNGMAITSGSIGLRITTDAVSTTDAANLRIMKANAVAGTHVAGSGTTPNFTAERIVLSLADLNNGPFYIGNGNAAMNGVWTSIATGNWNNSSNWDQGSVPPAGADVIIGAGTTITNTGTSASLVNLKVNGTLIETGGSTTVSNSIINNGLFSMNGATVSLGPTGGGKQSFVSNGALNMISGNLNINGNLSLPASSSFEQTGGTITIDGNSGTPATSVQLGTALMGVNTQNFITSGGTVVFVDPHAYAPATSSSAALLITATPVVPTSGAGHTFQFGNGVSNTAGGNIYGFLIYAGDAQLGNIVVNDLGGTNRKVLNMTSLSLAGDLSLNTPGSEYYIMSTLYLNGNLNVNAGTTLTTVATINFCNYYGAATLPSANAQLVSGSGNFKNSLPGSGSPSTGAFGPVIINNSTTSGVRFNVGNFRMEGQLTFILGKLTMLNGSTVWLPQNTPINGASQQTGWVHGRLKRGLYSGRGFEIGTESTYTPVMYTSRDGGFNLGEGITIQAFSGDHPNIAASGINPNKSVNYYLSVDTSEGISGKSYWYELTPIWPTSIEDPNIDFRKLFMQQLNGSTWSTANASYATPSSLTMECIGSSMKGIYQIGEAAGAPIATTPPVSQTTCAGKGVAFYAGFLVAASYQWQMNTGSGWTDLSNTTDISGATADSLKLLNPQLSMNGYQYRCIGTNDLGSTTSAVATLNVTNVLNPTISVSAAPGNVICANTTITFTATVTNAGTAPDYQWQVNGFNTGSNSPVFSSGTLTNGSIVLCTVTSNSSCSTFPAVTSTPIIITVNPTTNPSVSIAASPATTNCAGTNVTFTATPVNGGTTPAYQWKKNGVVVGTNAATYSNAALINTDVITCVLTTSNSCASSNIATSNALTMTVTAPVTPTISITSSNGSSICTGTANTFTATTTFGGSIPTFDWKKNGTSVATGSSYTTPTLVNGDVISCVLTSSQSCVTSNTANSNSIVMSVSSSVSPAVSIAAAPGNTVCSGTSATYTASHTNGGTSPAYQWKINGGNVGSSSSTFTATPANGDIITCVLTSSSACASPATVTSNGITMVVTPTVTPTISITASPATTVCSGTSVTFNTTITNGGTNPVYQWKKNGVNVATGSTYSTSALATADVITCELTSMAPCATAPTVTSNAVTMTINPAVTPTISISTAGGTTLCAGTIATLTAAITNGGSLPVYAWKINGNPAGTNAATFTTTALANGDVVTCQLTSNAVCATIASPTSNAISFVINPAVAATASVTANPGAVICNGTPVTFTVTNTNGGVIPANQWKKNGINIGTNSLTYTDAGLNNGDVITCVLTSSLACAAPVTSNPVSMTVNTTLSPVTSVTANPGNTICTGNAVTFTATVANPGTSNTYTWKKNGVAVGTNSNIYTDNTLVNGDVITCSTVSVTQCSGPVTTSSLPVTIVVTSAVTPTVSVTASPGTTISAGQIVTFTANASNAGTSPVYQWKKNGINVGTNSNIYATNSLVNNDVISVTLQSSMSCASPTTVTGNSLTILVSLSVSNTGTSSGAVSVYPNPTSGMFTISASLTKQARQATIVVRNMQGQVILRKDIETKNGVLNTSLHLDEGVTNGIYQLQILTPAETTGCMIRLQR